VRHITATVVWGPSLRKTKGVLRAESWIGFRPAVLFIQSRVLDALAQAERLKRGAVVFDTRGETLHNSCMQLYGQESCRKGAKSAE